MLTLPVADNMKPKDHRSKARRNTILIAAAMLGVATLHAGTPQGIIASPSAPNQQDSVAEKPQNDVSYKELAVLYSDKDNPIIEKFSLYGEFSAQWATGDSNRGSFDSGDLLPSNNTPSTLWGDIDARRWRLGFRAQVLKKLKVVGIIDINPNFDPFYRDIYEAYVTYAASNAFNLSVGKRKAHFFTQEYNTPSRELIVFEQSLLTGALIPKELTGAWVNGKIDHWFYTLAVYPGDYQTEFSRFNAGIVTQASLGYDFASTLHVDTALVRFDYQTGTSGENSYGPEKFSNAFSLNTVFQEGKFYGYTDFLGGIGRGTQGDVWGVILTPTYFLFDDKLQIVLRYQYAHGENNGLKLQSRYEALAPDIQDTKGKGNDYNALYLGLNYYIHRHNLKLMTGVEFSDMSGGPKGYSGWTYLTGLRLAF